MIVIVRLQAQENREKLWEELVGRRELLQGRMAERGQLLFLTRRAKAHDVSVLAYAVDPDPLADFIADDLSRVPHVTAVWLLNLLKPVLYPLPLDSKSLKRFSVSLRVFPGRLAEVYDILARSHGTAELTMAYLGYTFHLFEDCIQFSVLGKSEEALNEYLHRVVAPIPGVLRSMVNEIETTLPLVSHEEWQKYVAMYPVPAHPGTEEMARPVVVS